MFRDSIRVLYLVLNLSHCARSGLAFSHWRDVSWFSIFVPSQASLTSPPARFACSDPGICLHFSISRYSLGCTHPLRHSQPPLTSPPARFASVVGGSYPHSCWFRKKEERRSMSHVPPVVSAFGGFDLGLVSWFLLPVPSIYNSQF